MDEQHQMDEQQLRRTALEILQSIAPEVEPADLVGGEALRNQVDLDSMDWLNFLIALHEKLQVEIPEADYARLVTMDDVVAYLGAKLSAR
jgi:acyl carrier protein